MNITSKKSKKLLSYILLVAIILVLISLFIVMFDGFISHDLVGLLGADSKGDALARLGLTCGGVILMFQALASNSRADAMEFGLTQDRFKNAIEHLGSEKSTVRYAAIYELYHLAKDESNLRSTIIDILCSFVRQTSESKEYSAKYKNKPSLEIQTIVNLLFDRKNKLNIEKESFNLSNSYLVGANFSFNDVINVRFNQVDLTNCKFSHAKLDGCTFYDTQLDGVDFYSAKLNNCTFYNSDFKNNTNFEHVELFKINFMENRLLNTNFLNCNFLDCTFEENSFYDNISFYNSIFKNSRFIPPIEAGNSVLSEKQKNQLV